jgi:4-hydroxy-tetrahydrodipicolinate reductase
MSTEPGEMRLVVAGAGGRMGQALLRTIHAMEGVAIAGAFDRAGTPAIGRDAGELAGLGPIGIVIQDDPAAALGDADGLVDFTAPAATVELAALAARKGLVHIIGTTGCSDEDEDAIRAAGAHARIVKSGNMSLGVNLMAVLVEQAARALDAADWDIEVLEMHHRHKVDAPSGTALLLGEAAAHGRAVSLAERSVRVRDGHTGARVDGTIGFATLRGGSVVGEHSVIIAGEGETITLGHQATDRALFARGAVKAALWARRQAPGLYSMRDVLGLSSHN